MEAAEEAQALDPRDIPVGEPGDDGLVELDVEVATPSDAGRRESLEMKNWPYSHSPRHRMQGTATVRGLTGASV